MSMNDIMKLKERTGAGLKDCKEALEAGGGDFDRAVAILREKGKAIASKKADRIAADGYIGVYSHGGKIGVAVEVNCETDFAAKAEAFQELVKNVAMQIAASAPLYVDETEVPAEELKREKEILRNRARAEKKPENVIEKMLDGQVKKYYAEVCLLDQPYIKDQAKTVRDVVTETTAKVGEKISIRRFVRFALGEGIEKRKEDFAQEVAKVTGKKK